MCTGLNKTMCCVSWGVGSHTRDDSATEYMYGNCEEHLGARKKELTTENTASVGVGIQYVLHTHT